MPFYPFLGEGSIAKRDYRTKGALILCSRLEDLERDTTRKTGSWTKPDLNIRQLSNTPLC